MEDYKIELYEFMQVREEKRKIQEKLDYILSSVLMYAHLIEDQNQKLQYSMHILKLNTQMKNLSEKEKSMASHFSLDFPELALSLLEKK